jgi:hypothetical protein
MPTKEEWFWAGIICAVPILVFAVIELVALRRRKRAEAIARRSKTLARGRRG